MKCHNLSKKCTNILNNNYNNINIAFKMYDNSINTKKIGNNSSINFNVYKLKCSCNTFYTEKLVEVSFDTINMFQN